MVEDPVTNVQLPKKESGDSLWRDPDLEIHVTCIDGVNRSCNGLRIAPTLLKDISTIPHSKLYAKSSKMNLQPFLKSTSTYGLPFMVKSTIAHSKDTVRTPYSQVPISDVLPVSQALDVSEDDMFTSCLINPSGTVCLFKKSLSNPVILKYDLIKEEIISEISYSDIDIYHIPESVLLEHLPEEYISDLMVKEI